MESKEKSKLWTAEEVELFQLLLKKYGTDFHILSNFFPKKTKNQLKVSLRLYLEPLQAVHEPLEEAGEGGGQQAKSSWQVVYGGRREILKGLRRQHEAVMRKKTLRPTFSFLHVYIYH